VRPSNLLHLYWVRVRGRFVQELLAVIGIAVGVALLFAASVANTSLTGSVERLIDGIVGRAQFQVAARAADGFDEALLANVHRIPEVRAAAPMLDVRATLVGPSGRASVDLVGGDPSFARLGGSLLRPFHAGRLVSERGLGLPDSIARRTGVSLGETLALEVRGQRKAALVGAVLHREDIGDLVDSPVAIAPLAYVQLLAQLRGRITRIYVEPEPGRGRAVERALRDLAQNRLDVRSARYDARLFAKAALPTNNSTTLFAAFSAGIGFLFAFSAMLLTVPQRRRLLADLRIDGYGAAAAVQVLLVDAVFLGLVGSLGGLALGDVLSRVLFSGTPGYLAYTFPIGSQRIVTAGNVALALGGGFTAAGAAVLNPYGRIVDRSRWDGPSEPRSLIWASLVGGGLAGVVVTTLILLLAPQLAILGMACLTASLLLLLGPAVAALLRVVDRVTRRSWDAASFIALAELRGRRHRLRAGAIVATGAIAVLSSVAIEGAGQDLERGLDAAVRDIDSTAAIWITAAGANNTFATTALADSTPGALAKLRGVAAVRIYRGSFLDWGDRHLWVLGPPRDVTRPVPPSQVARGDVSRATARLREGGWAVVSRAVASEHRLTVGKAFTLPSPVPTRLRVAALSTNLGWPPGAILLNADDYARAWGSSVPSAYQLVLRPGARPGLVEVEARRALGLRSALLVETARQREQRHYASTRDALARLTQIRMLVLIAAVLAMAAAMGGLIWQRRARVATLKLDGFTEAELWRAFVLESVLLLGAGSVLGAVLGLYGQVLLSRALATITGFPVVLSLGIRAAVVSVVGVTAIAALVVAVPGYLAVRVEAALAPHD
jgi:putative ABC transport system permease protein